LGDPPEKPILQQGKENFGGKVKGKRSRKKKASRKRKGNEGPLGLGPTRRLEGLGGGTLMFKQKKEKTTTMENRGQGTQLPEKEKKMGRG